MRWLSAAACALALGGCKKKEAPSVPHVPASPSSVRSPQPGYASRSGDRPEKAGDARPTHGQPPNRRAAGLPSEDSWPHRKLTPSAEEPNWTPQDWRSESRTPDTPPEFGNNRTLPDEQRPERIPAMPQWNGYVAPGVGMKVRKPRQWWTYTAALALFAALGFAALMMFNPDSITRARIEALTHQTSSTRKDAQAANPGPARNPTASTNASPSPARPSPSSSSTAPSSTSSDAAGLNAQAPPVQQEIPEDAGSSPSTNPTRPGVTQNERDHAANEGASQGTQNSSARPSKIAPHDRPAKVPAPTGQAKQYAYRFGGVPQGSRVAEAPVNSDYRPGGAYSQQGSSTSSSPAANSRGTYASQPQNSANSPGYGSSAQRSPSPSAQPGSAQSTQPPPSTSAAGNFPSNQPMRNSTGASGSRPVQQRDQDAYAHYSTNLPATSTSNRASRSNSQSQISSIQVPSSRIYPVPPSVPLVGVPSGSVAATSVLHAIRVSSELQTRSSQLVGNLQIGELVSSYSPAYPIGAAREGIEGTVRLAVIVAREGTVRSVQIMSGPPMLASSAANAVRDWRYGETFLSGQAIETEQYVTIVFRLAK